MKFLHISDMHFDPANDGEDTYILREKFMNYLKEKNIIVDEIFFTGDFRHALHQMGQSDEETAKNACEFLVNIAQCTLKSNKNIYSHLHIVPGNHDLSRGDVELLNKIYDKYDPDKANFKEIIENEQTGLNILLSRFDFFQRCAEILKNDIWTDMLNGQVCYVKEIEECNIIYINTAIASGRKIDRGNLYVGRQYIANAFRQAVKRNPKKPIIVLAHNIINDIEKDEQLKIKNFINDLEIPVVWLCGDSHDTKYDNSYNTAYITAGCLIQERGTEASFFVGNLDDDGLSFEAHGFDNKNSGWEYKEIISKRLNNTLPDVCCGVNRKKCRKCYGSVQVAKKLNQTQYRNSRGIIMFILNHNTIISECLETAFKLKTYMEIMQTAQSTNFKATDEYRKMYKGFYNVRQRSCEWYDKYFLLMEEQSTENRSFEDLLRIMFKEHGKIEVSFVSKLMATINPQLPIWDKFVLINLGKAAEWERFRTADVEKRIKEAAKIYADIESWYKDFIEADDGKVCIAKFDELLPIYKDKLTDIKKIDYLLWSKR